MYFAYLWKLLLWTKKRRDGTATHRHVRPRDNHLIQFQPTKWHSFYQKIFFVPFIIGLNIKHDASAKIKEQKTNHSNTINSHDQVVSLLPFATATHSSESSPTQHTPFPPFLSSHACFLSVTFYPYSILSASHTPQDHELH